MVKCIVCKENIEYTLYEFIKCNNCNSYMYISNKRAEQENYEYFEDMYKIYKNLNEDTKKRELFNHFQLKDIELRKTEYEQFNNAKKHQENLIFSKGKVLEIGFGEGDYLYSLLKNGVDGYGIDISRTAVNNFRERYPQYADRVKVGRRFCRKVEIIYCCALFEHLDTPDLFISDVSDCLDNNGILIIDGIPIINRKRSEFTPGDDICFWKPCHRVIYSQEGLELLFKKYGFQLMHYGVLDNYNYRLLSMHIKKGYQELIRLRNPCLDYKNLPKMWSFKKICKKALCVNSLALYGLFIFKKLF